MKVIRKYDPKTVLDYSTGHLIDIAVTQEGGELEQLADAVRRLQNLVGEILDRLPINDEEKINLTGADFWFAPAPKDE